MPKKTFLSFLFVLCFCSLAAAQTDSRSLAVIDLQKVNDLNRFEELKLPALHFFGNSFITAIDKSQTEELKRLGIEYSVIDGDFTPNSYSIISQRRGTRLIKPAHGKILLTDGNAFLARTTSSDVERLRNNGFKVTELNSSPSSFTSIKMINPGMVNSPIDSLIKKVVAEINTDSVTYFVSSLQNFRTRYALADTRDKVAVWIAGEFRRMGFTDVVLDSFYVRSTWQKNVIATLHSSVPSDENIFIGGHHDSYSSGTPLTVAPGADDNASGTTAVLEMARAIMKMKVKPKVNIRFMTFAAEELGLLGSDDYAKRAKKANMKIKLMINHDMISYSPGTGNTGYINLNSYTGYEAHQSFAIKKTNLYSNLTGNLGNVNSTGSDSYSFWVQGYPAIYFEEYNFTPNYHTPKDLYTNANMAYCAEVIKASCATMLAFSDIPDYISGYMLADAGTGSTLIARWNPSKNSDVHKYRVYVGTSSGNYSMSFLTSDTSAVISGLTTGTKYFVGIAAESDFGSSSFIAERYMTPQSAPLSPSGFSAVPGWKNIVIKWQKNTEADILGYNLFRTDSTNGTTIRLNKIILTDSSYTDNDVLSGRYYYYSIKAIDSTSNESPLSPAIKSRAVTMDRGILVVDETEESGTGPSDSDIDNFYSYLTKDLSTDIIDVRSSNGISLADLGAYSTVIWHADDTGNLSTPYKIREDIKKYLDYGGRFFYNGNRPSVAFENNNSSPAQFAEGSLMHDYFKIEKSLNKFQNRFIGAAGSSGYPSIFVDTLKTSSSTNYHLSAIESITPSSEGTEIFTYETRYPSTTGYGSMKGMPVGVEFIGTKYRTIILSFPLFYMKKEQAKALMQHILRNKFNETVAVQEQNNNTTAGEREYRLGQNYPNPFNPVTRIDFSIPRPGLVTLKVFDILGREISLLVSGYKSEGSYSVNFDASSLSSGIYYYTLCAEDFISTRKMILIK